MFMINRAPQLFLHDWFPFKVPERFRKDELFTTEYIYFLVPKYCVLGTILPSPWTEFYIPYVVC